MEDESDDVFINNEDGSPGKKTMNGRIKEDSLLPNGFHSVRLTNEIGGY